jgi:hypothetical protein
MMAVNSIIHITKLRVAINSFIKGNRKIRSIKAIQERVNGKKEL